MGKRKHNVSPEGRAKLSARLKERWATNREEMLEQARRGGRNRVASMANRRPQRGTEDWRLFEKIRCQSNSSVAHAYFHSPRAERGRPA